MNCVFTLIFVLITFNASEADSPNKIQKFATNKTLHVHSKFPKNRLGTKELVQESGFDCEDVEVITEDGYLLRLFHILSSNISQDLPILLLHGFWDSSDTFCIRRESSLAINLAESGYDVWLANMRGNRYSRRHITLDPDVDGDFWNFTFHENGYYDYPAIIDKILKRTGKSQLIAIGHSQGTLNYFVMGSARPKYNHKVKLFIALAPVFYSQDNRGLAAVAYIDIPIVTSDLWRSEDFAALEQVELLGEDSSVIRFLRDICTKFKERSYKMCLHGLFFSNFGGDTEQIELEFVPTIMTHYFAGGASTKLIAHAIQLVHGQYSQIDYGRARNMEVYGSPMAPLYNLTNISTKVVLMVGKNDFVATVSDSMRLLDALPNATYFEIPRELFAHLDFVWSNQMSKYLYPYLHKFLNEYK